jgi:hypothetical protein
LDYPAKKGIVEELEIRDKKENQDLRDILEMTVLKD